MGESLTASDQALLQTARQIISLRFREGFHHVGAAVRTRSGRTFAAVHLEANLGRADVCAEAVAIGMAAAAGDTDLDTIVSVDRKGNVISPCGLCRELISDYAADCRVIVPNGNDEAVVRIGDLLPNKYKRRWSHQDPPHDE
jgi:cytidine deaminase